MFLVVNILKFDINCTFFWDYFQLTKPKTKKQDLGALPQTPLSLARPQGMWQNLSTFPWAGVESIQGVKGEMHDCVAARPLSISLGVAKRSEADGAGNLSRLAKQPRSNGLYWLEATQRSVVGVQGLSRRRRLHPCHVANAGVGSAHGFDKPPRGARSRG